MPNLKGSLIQLRHITRDDLDKHRYWQQPGHTWQAFDGPYFPKPSMEEVDRMITKIRSRIETDNWPIKPARLVIADSESNQLIGTVSRYWISQETHWTAVGIAIYDPAFWGRGIGFEALGMWIDYLFDIHPEWVRLGLRTWSGNERMMRLALKLGLQEEARFRKARIVNGRYYDGLGYGILREEWIAQHKERFKSR